MAFDVNNNHEFPKWVLVHESHIVRRHGSAPVVQSFSNFHVNRVDNSVTVLVHDADEEQRALAEYREDMIFDLISTEGH